MTKSKGIKVPRGEAFSYFTAHRYESVEGCKLWPYNVDKDGYGMVWIDGSGRYKRLGVVACEDRWGPMPEPGMVAAHGDCHNPLCWNQDHLTWKTHKQNALDRERDGTTLYGESNSQARLTNVLVLEIRAKHAEGVAQHQLRREYGLSSQHISNIVNRKRWAHL